jgi:hypothetical protein
LIDEQSEDKPCQEPTLQQQQSKLGDSVHVQRPCLALGIPDPTASARPQQCSIGY